MKFAIACVLLLASTSAGASPPLIYEGTLTTDGAAPDPWPALRFSLVGADGVPLWSSVVDEEGPIEFGPGGQFIVYLDTTDGDDGLLDPSAAEAASALQIDVCLARENQPGCAWLPLEAAQQIGQVPMAATARLAPPPREVFAIAQGEPQGPDNHPWAWSEVSAEAPVDGIYLIGASYSCRSTCDPEDGANARGRYPHEQLFIDGDKIIDRLEHKNCNANEPFEEKVFLPVFRHLTQGQTVRFRAIGWGCNHYRYANITLSPVSQDDLPPR